MKVCIAPSPLWFGQTNPVATPCFCAICSLACVTAGLLLRLHVQYATFAFQLGLGEEGEKVAKLAEEFELETCSPPNVANFRLSKFQT